MEVLLVKTIRHGTIHSDLNSDRPFGLRRAAEKMFAKAAVPKEANPVAGAHAGEQQF